MSDFLRSSPLRLLALAALLTSACTAPREEAPPGRHPEQHDADEIGRAEYERERGDLLSSMRDDDPRVRARTALALGRCGGRARPPGSALATGALIAALQDPEPEVRRAAAFGLGLDGDPSSLEAVLDSALGGSETEPLVRALSIEAASKLMEDADPATVRRYLAALSDEEPRVRAEAAVGTHRFATEGESAAIVDESLIAALVVERDGDVRWRQVFALARRAAPGAKGAFVDLSSTGSDLERVYAVRGLSALDPSPDVGDALEQATSDEDWRVAVEALNGLSNYPDHEFWRNSRRILEHDSHHVRRAAWQAWGRLATTAIDWERSRPSVSDVFRQEETSDAVVAAAIEATLSLFGRSPKGVPRSPLSLEQPPPWYREASTLVRAGVARGVAHYPSGEAIPALDILSEDPEETVAAAAIEGLGQNPGPRSRQRLHSFLAHPDNGLRLAAVLALREMPDPTDLRPLERAWRTTRGDIATEVKFNILKNAGAIGGEDARAILEAGLSAGHPYVAHVALEEFQRAFPGRPVPRQTARDAGRPAASNPLPDRDPELRENPRVDVETSRGTMTFELFPSEAPAHVHNFLTLAEEDHYDGLIFHRVVPDFVIQGGDYRGDGNGGVTWNERPLPHEIGMRKYMRGSLGMPRNEDWDSGGSQIFVTHRPTPHLDGRYTIFGELREGLDVLDAIEQGDEILDVAVRPSAD